MSRFYIQGFMNYVEYKKKFYLEKSYLESR
uniref:Uncharacterized protein n=1 Tax=Anguilla anguilla TaxID=7936 RepID=A0A0E9PMC3_ANGAN